MNTKHKKHKGNDYKLNVIEYYLIGDKSQIEKYVLAKKFNKIKELFVAHVKVGVLNVQRCKKF
jgi:hypothetical protein